MRRVSIPTFLAVGLVLGCPNGSSQEDTVLLLLKTADNPFFESIQEGVEDAWRDASKAPALAIRAGSSEGNIGSQRRILETFISNNVLRSPTPTLKGLLLTPSSSGTELTRAIKQLREHDIPVVLIDTRISEEALEEASTDYTAFLGSENYDGGVIAAEELANHTPAGGTLLLLNGVESHETAGARRDGFLHTFRTLKPTVEVSQRTCNWRKDEARRTVSSLLAFDESFDAIFAANDEMALGAVAAYKRAGRSLPPIVGFDATDDALRALKRGEILATVAQDPYTMGYQGALKLLAVLRGEEVAQKDIVIPVKLVKSGQ